MMLADLDDDQGLDICRVCRSEATPDRQLFHPCICTGSIKWIHQECLMQWMRYSRKEYCELCRHQFSFTPIYAPNMPRRLPITDIVAGLASSVTVGVKNWLHYSIVCVAWLGIVPLIACRIFRCLFSGSYALELFSTNDLPADIFQGSFIVTCTLFTFIGLVWLREQIISGGGPVWLELAIEDEAAANRDQQRLRFAEQVLLGPIQPDNEPAQEGGGGDRGQNNVAAVDEHNNWNAAVEWDRAAEELTWERLLGLDGSLIFIEHVFWVISLNFLFIVVFAFLPYSIGYYFLLAFNMTEYASISKFEGLMTAFTGYVGIGVGLFITHLLISFTQFSRIKRCIGMAYVVIKVSILLVLEIGTLPLICGWWLDICSLLAFNTSLGEREQSFLAAPGTSMFIHWLVGMVFVYYFASFILLLREVLRPGVLWFLRNLNDPDFSPIQEMIHLPMIRHIRRLMASAVIFGVIIILVVWIPAWILKTVWPSFLPYTVSNHSDQVNELSLELLLLQVIMPAILEQSYIRSWFKGLLYWWCVAVSWCLNIRSYLLGNEEQRLPAQLQQELQRPAPNADLGPAAIGGGLGAAHQALLQRGGPTGFQPYTKPKYFGIRLLVLMCVVCASVIVASLMVLTVPVVIGRKIMSFWPFLGISTKFKPDENIHELYTASAGTYFCWLVARSMSILVNWLKKGRLELLKKLWNGLIVVMKAMIVSFWLVGVIPLLCGLLLDLTVAIPFRVPLNQTPIIWLWQDWALGILYAKIFICITVMGPDWRLKRALDTALRNGLRRIDINHTMKEIVVPVIVILSVILAIPYLIAHSIVPFLTRDFEINLLVARHIYPFLFLVTLFILLLVLQVKQFKRLYVHIKNDKYLVGKKLVNYNHKPAMTSSETSPGPSSTSESAAASPPLSLQT